MAELFLVQAPTVPIPDLAARKDALDIRRSFLVEAPAGSGKTGLLIQRYLKLLTDPAVSDPAQVLAITFTLKATAEMRERILDQLIAARDGMTATRPFDRTTRPLAEAVVARDRAEGWNLLDSPSRFNIRTIDSVCAQIARSLPILSGSGARAAPIENAQPLHLRAARRTLMQLGGPDDRLNAALSTLLLHRDGNLADCGRLLADMLATRDQWGRLVPLTEPDLDEEFLERTVRPRLERALELAVCRALTRLGKIMPVPLQRALAGLASRMSEADGYKGAESPLAICRELQSAPGQAAEDLAHWRALIHLVITPSSAKTKPAWRAGFNKNHVFFEITKPDKAELQALVGELSGVPGLCEALCGVLNLPPTQYPDDQWEVTKALFHVLSRALVELQLVFAESGQCDFTEVSLLAHAALKRDEASDDLNAALGMSLQHLLVDEMQDTSTSQYELIQLLTERWDGASQTVFLVGDPKQSIYLFRQARVERFVDTMRHARLGDIPLTVLQLTANFRSQRKLVEDFNQTFAAVFSDADSGEPEQVPYVRASPVRDASAAKAMVWHTHLTPYSSIRAECTAGMKAQTLRHAAEIAETIAAWRGRSDARPETSKIGVLVRNKAHLHEIIPALKQLRIPFRAVEIEPLGERQEVLDLTSLTRALLHPADRVAWLALLRSPACGLTLADLHRLTGADDDNLREVTIPELIDRRGQELSEDGIGCLERIYATLQAAERQRGRLPLSEWVERTWRSLGFESVADEEELRNANRFFALLDQLEQPGHRLDLATLEENTSRLFAEAAVHPGAVDLMTIHKAKGLEWDVVFVPSLEKIGRSNTGRLLAWMEVESDQGSVSNRDESAAPGILAPIAGKGQENDLLKKWMRSIESAREAAERSRLFYVACTRAREELHLFAAPAARKDGGANAPPGSLLKAAWAAAEPHFLTAAPTPFLQPELVLDLAAAAQPLSRSLPLQRIPDRAARTAAPLPRGRAPRPLAPLFERPEGSFAARAYGNAVHALLEQVTAELAASTTPARLLADLPAWSARASALLRASGIAPALIDRLAHRALATLATALRDPDGLWLLGPHAGAASEQATISWADAARDRPQTIRVDRIFYAGATPRASGEQYLWIVDYKTTIHGSDQLESFLEQQRLRYAPQLQAYARELAQPGQITRLALYFPALPRLVWWE